MTDLNRRALLLAAVVTMFVTMAAAARAETYRPAYTLLDPGAVPADDLFGTAVALAGEQLLVGASGPDWGSLSEIGHVYVFDVANGNLLRTVVDPTAASRTTFGAAVASLGGNILVGAPGTAGGGAAYLIDGTTGAVLHTFTSPTAGTQFFGGYVGTLGGAILIGSNYFGGGAEVFDAGTYAHLRSLPGPFLILATAGDNLVVSANQRAELRDGGTGAVIRTFADPVPGGLFPGAAGVVGDTILVSDAAEDGIEIGEGAVYAFDSASGALVYTLHPPDTYETFSFGTPIAVSGSTVFIAAQRGGEDGAGEVTVWNGTTGTLLDEIYPPHPPQFGVLSTAINFGSAIAADGERTVVGVREDTRSGPLSGVVHVYDRCGNGTRVAGEECDDGNTIDGDGCSATCRLEVCGSGPRTGCNAAVKTKLVAVDPYAVYNIKAKLTWQWQGTPLTPDAVGDPTTDASYVLCIYGAGASPVMQVATLAGGTCGGVPCWTTTANGFHYYNPALTPDGTLDLRVQSDRGKFTFVGIGETLGIPDHSCPKCPLPYSGTVQAQLVNTATGACWSSTFPTSTYTNKRGKLSARRH